ncbi:MAG: hypothetical protein KDA91_02275 [Planctomycetaceae bacterium]|nr:hypothetical protein [Planctomycetaceae bacterium]
MNSIYRLIPDWATMPLKVWGSLVFISVFIFAPTLSFDFVNWDDPAYIWHNELIRSWSPSNLFDIATQTVTRNYAPITVFSFLMDFTVWQMNPFGYHATSLVLHTLNGLLVFALVRQLTNDSRIAWLTAALFLVHPVQIETVAWISSRKGLLSGAFMLAALCFRLKKDLQTEDEGCYIAMLTGALLSKALAVVLPPIVLLYDVLVRREKLSSAVPRQFIPGLLSLLLLLYTMGAQNSITGGIRGHLSLSLAHIMAIDVTILTRYVRMLFWPSDLCVLYDPPTSGIALPVILGLAGWGAIAFEAYRRRNDRPMLFWMMATWFLLLFPVLNFFRITTLMNDRYLYLPCIVVFGLVSSGIVRTHDWLAEGSRQLAFRSFASRGLQVFSIVAVITAAVATRSHLPVWQNSESLWRHAMQHVPQLAIVHIQSAYHLHDSGRVREAIAVLRSAQETCEADALDRERMARTIAIWSDELTRVASRD